MTVPITRTSYVSSSADEAWDVLSQMYTRARPHAASRPATIRFETAATPQVAVDRGSLASAGGAFDASPEQVNIICVVGGRISLDFGRHGEVDNRPGDSYLYLPDSPADLRWEDFDALAVRLPMDLVADAAAQVTETSDTLRFVSPRPLSAAHGRLWRRTAETLWRQLSKPGSAVISPLVHRELLNLLSATVVSVFESTAIDALYVPGPGGVGPAALRRAVAYIDAHVSLPITVADIAEAAGTRPRAVQAAFRRHLNTTPTAYLQRARLDAARHDLAIQGPGDGDDMQAVATRWGFLRFEQFLQAYEQAFGQLPGQGAP